MNIRVVLQRNPLIIRSYHKKDKHKLGQSRNNPVFKVVGGKSGKSKNKPREVNIKLKNIIVRGKASQSTKEVTENLDAKLIDLQKKSVPLSGSSTSKSTSGSHIKPLTGMLSTSQIDMDSMMDNFKSNMQPTILKEKDNTQPN
jgi:hypothetical protein